MRSAIATATITMLFSSLASAQVFYCQGTQFLAIEDHKLENYKPENFKFQLNKDLDKSIIKFGQGGYFNGSESYISHWGNYDRWIAADQNSVISFDNGNFYAAESYAAVKKGILITAKCDKF